MLNLRTTPTPLHIDMQSDMFKWTPGTVFLDNYSHEYMPSWTHILVYRADVFNMVRASHLAKPTYNEHMIVTIRGMSLVLLFVNSNGKGGTRSNNRPHATDLPHGYMESADQVIHFKTWPFGKVTFVKCRDECGRDLPPRQAKGKFHRQFVEWCDNL